MIYMASMSIIRISKYIFFNTDETVAFHDLASLSDLSCELRESLTSGIEALSEKVAELNDTSKDAWKELSKIEDEVKKMVARVNAVADAQVR